jgi:hypothetical protein
VIVNQVLQMDLLGHQFHHLGVHRHHLYHIAGKENVEIEVKNNISIAFLGDTYTYIYIYICILDNFKAN